MLPIVTAGAKLFRGVSRLAGAAGLAGFLLAAALPAAAQYKYEPQSEIDPSIFRIDEKTYLGAQVDRALPLLDDKGHPFTLGERMGQPLIIVLSYYQCDGTCSVVNNDLKNLIAGVSRVKIGRDFKVVTISFDKNDTVDTVAKFKTSVGLPAEWLSGWTFSLPADPDALKQMTNRIGFKYFWSPRDRTFFHPGVFVVLSPEGRVTRYLYSLSTEARDVEMALIEAQAGNIGTPTDLANWAASLCYSYNYKEGKYTLNIPVFVGAGSLFFGIIVFSVSVVVYRRRRRKEGTV